MAHEGSSYPLDADLALAHQMADAASLVSLHFFRKELKQWKKPDGSLATEADLAVEDTLRALVARERPSDAFLGEERGETGTGTRRWIVDGIDGTVDFAAGSPNWGTLIALEIDGVLVVGVCDHPSHTRRYHAARGLGAFRRNGADDPPRRLSVTPTNELTRSRSFVPTPEWQRTDGGRRIAEWLGRLTTPSPIVEHPALQVASGGYELALFMIAGPWDIAAPALIVEEAGGRFTDFSGRADWTTGNAVFSNGHVHDDALRAIRAAAGPEA